MINALLDQEKEVIVKAFDKSSNHYWKTLSEIATATAVKLEDVIKIVMSSDEFVESSRRKKDGQPLFTTRKMYRERAPFFDKLLGAFKNRID